ncbi:AIPR family protein [Micromonospora sp. H61]|uniref:AIPR family protein n=1 Tax=Micromonospora sp. H61 TaxID=2824888 RepID=UPI001B5E6D93|nr:AIPR family protein [Micromonospora sp. H61]MBQ0994731.1 AIPR family protein [Micromonospora sp. H61]
METHIFRVKATEVPAGIPDDANPREANLNRQVYRKVKASLFGGEGSDGTGSFHLKHGGIVLVAEKVERLESDLYRLWFNPSVKQGVANGNHSYQLILAAQKEADIPPDQYVEIKVHVNVPAQIVPDLADGLNTSMQVREESLADLRNKFDWLKKVCESRPSGMKAISWHEGNDGSYDVREVLALLMALDPTRYPLEDPVGIENTYARVSSVFRAYLTNPERVEKFAPIALEALELYEYIRFSASRLWQGKFRLLKIADKPSSGSVFTFPFLLNETGKPEASDIRLTKAAAIPCLAAFRPMVNVDENGHASWKYDFTEVKSMWDQYGDEVMREVHDTVTRQHNGNTHYAGRSPMLYRATSKTLELADLRRQLARQ